MLSRVILMTESTGMAEPGAGALVMRLFRGRGPEWGSHQIRQPFAASPFAILMRDPSERQVGPGLAEHVTPAFHPS